MPGKVDTITYLVNGKLYKLTYCGYDDILLFLANSFVSDSIQHHIQVIMTYYSITIIIYTNIGL